MGTSKPITILHLSDLHYKFSRAYDQGVVLAALLKDIECHADVIGQPDIILFSGDLVHSSDEDRIYEKLYDNFLEKLLKISNCDHSRLYLTPGNHDIHRSYLSNNGDKQKEIQKQSANRYSLNELYLSGDAAAYARQKSREFFDFAEFFSPDGEIYRDEIISVYDLKDLGLSIINVNTAWLGSAGLEGLSDLQALAVPEAAISKAFDFVPRERFTIVNFHHPLEWLQDHSAQDFKNLAYERSDLFLCGHVHDPRPMITTQAGSGLIHNQSGALYTWRDDRYLGYTLLRIEPECKHTELTWRSYFDRRRAFDIATNIDGNQGCHYSSNEAKKYFGKIIDQGKAVAITSWVLKDVLPPLSEELSDGILDKPTSELFVPPPLTKIEHRPNSETDIESDEIETPVDFEDLISGYDNHIIESYPEHGKTTFLLELCRNIAKNSKGASSSKHIVPIYLPFSSFNPGTKRAEKAIRDKLPGSPAGCDLDMLLAEGCFTICVDDVVFSDEKRTKELRDFISKYKKNRFIISTTSFRRHQQLTPSFSLGAHFERVRLHQLRRSDLRKLARKIDETNGSEDDLLDKVVRELKAINVPATPLNSSLLMDLLTRDRSYSPLNRPALIERFVETLLKKRSLAEVERKRFDFRNQVHYLGHVSEHMCRTNCYILSYDELFNITSSYLAGLGFNFGAREIIDNAVVSKIFLENKLEDSVSFRFRAFLEFFVATRMRDSATFKEWVLSEERYLSYLNEIEYYAGLERSDLALLQTVSKRHLKHYLSVFGSNFDDVLKNDRFKSLPTSLEGSKKFADELAEQLREVPLSAEERDEILDAELPRDAEGRQEVFRPEAKEVPAKYILSLFMYTNLIKNTELIEDTEKRYHLSCVLKSWSSTILASFLSIPSLVKNRRMTLNGLTYIVSFPRDYSDEDVVRNISLSLPKEIARLVHLLIATEKLEQQLAQRTLLEADEPNVTSFLRSSLFIDLRLRNWSKEPKRFIDLAKDDRYFQEVMLSKAADVYRLGGMPKQIELELENEIVETYAKLYSPSKKMIEDLRNKKKASIRRGRHLRKLRAKLPGHRDE